MTQDIHVASRQVEVSDVLGLHLRVADKFVQSANAFRSEVRVHCKGAVADGTSMLSLLSLAAECGTMLVLEAEGCDAEDAVDALARLISAPPHDSDDQGGRAGVLEPDMIGNEGCARGRSSEAMLHACREPDRLIK
jgi:phosphocarrier protein